MSYRLAGVQQLWKHDGTEAIVGVTDGSIGLVSGRPQETLDDASFDRPTSLWTAGGDFTIGGGFATYLSVTNAGTLTQTPANMRVAAVASARYRFEYRIRAQTIPVPDDMAIEITSAFASEATPLPSLTPGELNHVEFTSAASPGNFVLSATSSGLPQVIQIEFVSLKPLEEINGYVVDNPPDTTPVGGWEEIHLVGIDRLLIQMETKILAVGNMAGSPTGVNSATARLACIGVPYYDPLINSPPEPVFNTPDDNSVADPNQNQLDQMSLSARAWQEDQPYAPVLHSNVVTADAAFMLTGTTPAVNVRTTWVVELGIFRSTAASGAGDQIANSGDFSVSMLDRCWFHARLVPLLGGTGASFDGTERIKASMVALKYQDISRREARDFRQF